MTGDLVLLGAALSALSLIFALGSATLFYLAIDGRFINKLRMDHANENYCAISGKPITTITKIFIRNSIIDYLFPFKKYKTLSRIVCLALGSILFIGFIFLALSIMALNNL